MKENANLYCRNCSSCVKFLFRVLILQFRFWFEGCRFTRRGEKLILIITSCSRRNFCILKIFSQVVLEYKIHFAYVSLVWVLKLLAYLILTDIKYKRRIIFRDM
jgi:hypothetical protein